MSEVLECVQQESTQTAGRASRETIRVDRATERHASLLGCVPSPSRERRRVWVIQAVVRATTHRQGRPGTPVGLIVSLSLTAPSGVHTPRRPAHGGATTCRRMGRHAVIPGWHGVPSSPGSTRSTGRRGRVPARGCRSSVAPSRSRPGRSPLAPIPAPLRAGVVFGPGWSSPPQTPVPHRERHAW